MLDNIKHAKENNLIASGEQHGKCKYSDNLLSEALIEISNGASVKATSKKYGISTSYLNKVNNGVYRAYLLSNLN